MTGPQLPTTQKPHFLDLAVWPAIGLLIAATATVGFTLWKAAVDHSSAVKQAAAAAALAKMCGMDPAALHIDLAPPFAWPIGPILSGGLTIAVAAFQVAAAARKDKRASDARSPQDLLGPLHVLHEAVLHRKGLSKDQDGLRRFRATIHVVDGNHYEQATDYVGGRPEDRRRAGRRWATNVGLVGLVVRDGKDPIVMIRKADDEDGYLDELVREFGYERSDAAALSRGRWAAMAVPITDDSGIVIACVYADSSDRDWFSDEIQELMIFCAKGIASFARVRYAKA